MESSRAGRQHHEREIQGVRGLEIGGLCSGRPICSDNPLMTLHSETPDSVHILGHSPKRGALLLALGHGS